MDYPYFLSGWPKGVDNIHADHELSPDTLRRGVNIDVMDSGAVRRRKGHTLVTALASAHSMWGNGQAAYFIRDNSLYRFYEGSPAAALGAFAAGANRAAYVGVDSDVFVTSATARGVIRGGAVVPWGINVPATPPVVAATTGVLPPGNYFLAVTYVDADGRESGASAQTKITLSTAGGVATTAMPVSLEAAVTRKRLYISTTDGEILYMAAEVAAAAQFVSISTLPTGAELRTAHLSPPPFGVALAHFNGKVYIVDAMDSSVVWFTEALDYDHVNIRKNYYKFGAPVTVIAAVDDGVYFVADQTWFISGAGGDAPVRRPVLEATGILGSEASIPDTTDVIWMSDRGAVIGKNGGEVQVLSGKQVSTGDMIDGAAFVREQDSVRQYVMVGGSKDTSALQAGSYAEAEVIRRAG